MNNKIIKSLIVFFAMQISLLIAVVEEGHIVAPQPVATSETVVNKAATQNRSSQDFLDRAKVELAERDSQAKYEVSHGAREIYQKAPMVRYGKKQITILAPSVEGLQNQDNKPIESLPDDKESKVEVPNSFLPSNETNIQNPISSSSNSAYLQLKKLGTQLQLSVAQFAKRFIGLGSHDTIASLQKSLADISSQMNDVAKAAKYNIDSLQSSDNHLQELFASIMKKKGNLENIVISKKELLGKANGHESSVEELKKLLEESPDPKNLGKNLLETYNKEINNLISSIQEFRNEIVLKMPADDLERQIKDEISIRKERAKNIETMKAIVPDRQAGYAADKAKKAAEKKPVLKGSPLSKGVKPLPAESSKSKEEKVQHAEPSKSKAKENDGLDSLINSTEEYFASISPEDADKMALESFNAMSEEEKQGGF